VACNQCKSLLLLELGQNQQVLTLPRSLLLAAVEVEVQVTLMTNLLAEEEVVVLQLNLLMSLEHLLKQ